MITVLFSVTQESPHLETSFKDMKKTRNLESYVQWFNRLSYFVATEVCKVNNQRTLNRTREHQMRRRTTVAEIRLKLR